MPAVRRTTRHAVRRCRHAVVLAAVLAGCAGAGQVSPGAIRPCRAASAPGLWTVQAGDVLQGVVGDTRGGTVEGATVRLRRLGADSASTRQATTGRLGAFGMDSVPPDRYHASAAAPGHGAWVDTVELAYGRGTIPRIQVCAGPYS